MPVYMRLNTILNFIAGCFVPHSFVTIRNQRRNLSRRSQRAERQATMRAFTPSTHPYSYDASIEYLTHQLGVSESALLAGSIRETSLSFIATQLKSVARKGHPLRVLHVGNFVGVSLCYIAAECVRLHGDSLVVAIDPNIKHRGVEHPESYVAKLLSHFGLQAHVLLICGYTLSKNLADDGFNFGTESADIERQFAKEAASENVLPNISVLCGRSFDIAVLDGNHSGDYLESELKVVGRLLKPEGMILLDDVNESWPEIQDVFSRLGQLGNESSSVTDGRVGVLSPRLLFDESVASSHSSSEVTLK